MATDWGKYIPVKVGKIIVLLLTILVMVVVSFGLFTNKHIKIWFIEFNGNKDNSENENPVTANKNIQPTTHNDSPINKESKRFFINTPVPHTSNKKNEGEKKEAENTIQNIDNEGSGIQNNAPNYGNQAGRDINNNYGIIPRTIDEIDLINAIEQFTKDRNFMISFRAFGSMDGEIQNVKNQIVSILKKNGFTNIHPFLNFTFADNPPNTISIKLFKDRIDYLEIQIPAAKQ